VDDITHMGFGDREHLWFDPGWRGKGKKTSKAGDDDPMAEMLENNAKNRNAAHVFVNKLAGEGSEYAEVDATASAKRVISSPGPYATADVIDGLAASHASVAAVSAARSNSVRKWDNEERTYRANFSPPFGL